MSLQLLLDNEMAGHGELMRPHYGIHDLLNLKSLKHTVGLPDVTETILSNWLNEEV